MSSSTETRRALPTLQKHAKRPPMEDPPCMCRRSAFSSSLLDQHSSPDAAAWFIGCRCRVSASVQRNSYSQCCPHQKKIVSEAHRQPSTLRVPTLGSIGILHQGLLPWLRCASCPTLSTLCLSHPLSMLLSEYEFAASQCVGTCQHQHSQPICHGVLCMVQRVLPSVCVCVVSPSSPKVSTQSLSSHCVDHIPPSATRIFRTTLCTRCVSLGVPLPRKLWRRLGSAAGAAFASSSLSRKSHFLSAALIVALSWMDIKIGSPIDATMLSASSA